LGEVEMHAGAPEDLKGTDGGRLYGSASAVFGSLVRCLSPEDMLHTMLIGVKALHVEAGLVLKAKDPEAGPPAMDADTLFPLLVYAIVGASKMLKDVHVCIYLMRNFSDGTGEAEYYLTALEAAVSFVMKLKFSSALNAACQAFDEADGAGSRIGAGVAAETAESAAEMLAPIVADAGAMENLGRWIARVQESEEKRQGEP